jgi:NAD(P)-dependent dehydrogenase (short-subunit alcohol dehydrogenase family)
MPALMGQLDNKTALVTGASTGIGLAIARRFAAGGATVYLTGRRKAELDAAVEQVGSHGIGIQSDVSTDPLTCGFGSDPGSVPDARASGRTPPWPATGVPTPVLGPSVGGG